MNRIVMLSSALVLAVIGLGATFMPQELITAWGGTPSAPIVIVLQLLGAAWLGLAMMNWMARGSLIGGIYNRPLAVGNLLHFAVGAIALAKLVLQERSPPMLIAFAIMYGLLAAGFAAIVFGSPLARIES